MTQLVVIGSNVWAGDNSVVVGSLQIRNDVMSGFSSIVTRDILEDVIVGMSEKY